MRTSTVFGLTILIMLTGGLLAFFIGPVAPGAVDGIATVCAVLVLFVWAIGIVFPKRKRQIRITIED